MKLGLYPPLFERSWDNGTTPRFTDIQAMCRDAEDAGFHSFWIADHLLYRDPGEAEKGAWEAFTTLGALAASTSRIFIGPLVASTSFRNPGLLAKMADTLDEISGGRFLLGLGCGWNQPEYTAFGYPFDRRVDRFEEAIAVISGLVHGGRSDLQGKYYDTHDAVLLPRGPSQPGPPIWIGAKGPRMLRLVARYADVWNADSLREPELYGELRASLDEACAEVGRDPTTLPGGAWTGVEVLAAGESASGDGAYRPGTAEEIALYLQQFAEAGADHMLVRTKPSGRTGIERLARVRELLQHQ